jgi:hypothetical protein
MHLNIRKDKLIKLQSLCLWITKIRFVLQALIVHYQSYGNTIKVILSVDEEVFPDYSQLLDDFADSFRNIKDAASML